MSYSVLLQPAARKALDDLPGKVRGRVLDRLKGLQRDPRPPNCAPLRGPLAGLYKLRVGQYRVAYEVDDEDCKVIVWEIGHRSKAYDHLERRQT